MIEYFAAGLPVISTRHGMRGICIKDNVLICELAEFNKNIRKTLNNPALYNKMRQASLTFSKNYDWSILVKRLEKTLNASKN
jgi:glycosyltransferase involved in cell wall biosynthesis